MTETTTADMPEALSLADALDELDGQFSYPGLCGDAAAELRRLHALIAAALTAQEAAALQIDPVDNATGETMCKVRFFIETPEGWVDAYHKAPLELLLSARAKEGKA